MTRQIANKLTREIHDKPNGISQNAYDLTLIAKRLANFTLIHDGLAVYGECKNG